MLALCGAAFAAPLLHAQDRTAKVPELQLSTALGPTFPLGRAGERWAQLVNEARRGRLRGQAISRRNACVARSRAANSVR